MDHIKNAIQAPAGILLVIMSRGDTPDVDSTIGGQSSRLISGLSCRSLRETHFPDCCINDQAGQSARRIRSGRKVVLLP